MATRAISSLGSLLARARSGGQYLPLPVFDRSSDLPPHKPQKSSQRKALWGILGALVVFGLLYEIVHYARHRSLVFPKFSGPDPYEGAGFAYPLTGAGGLYRDSHPLRTMKMFWELAEKEVKASGLDECGSQMGRGLIDAYLRSNLTYCTSPDVEEGPEMLCTPVKGDPFSDWWPHQAAPCVSRNFRPADGHTIAYYFNGCTVTPKGQELKDSMGEEKFAGTWMYDVPAPDPECKEVVNRTIIEIIRQDQWNPFHVAEDLLTTLVTSMIAVQLRPELLDTKVQLVFGDDFEIEKNHYSSLYDRVGAWAPRRLALDPWQEGTCLTNTIHSINAAASIMTAMQVNHEYNCASTLAWGGAHYWRHLMGLAPYEPDKSREQPINVLWLSRARYDEYAKAHDRWNSWKAWRHIDNEDEMLDRFRRGLREFCEERNCEFEDTQHTGFDTWDQYTKPGQPRKVRFAWIDPSVHDFGTQMYLVGHSSVLMSVHSGALGLELFLPPGRGNVIEIQAPSVVGWHHYDIMSHELGHHYEMSRIGGNWADVDGQWQPLERALHREWERRDEVQGIVKADE